MSVAEAALTDGWETLRAGPLATVQDLGRPGRLREGIPPAGAMDPVALQIGNLLCGNARGTAGLEVALGGLVLRACADQIVAVTGADFSTVMDGNRVPRWKSFAVRAGQTLSFGAPVAGAWAYLCIAGGVAVPAVLGGRSTCLAAQFGGLAGRALKVGDRIPIAPPTPVPPTGRGLALAEIPAYREQPAKIRVVRGPQAERFPPTALAAFFSAEFTVSAQSNRMGYRLQGPALIPTDGDLMSEATAAGAVQVPAGGQPIVLLNDRPATGGYPKIATVISADLPVLTQAPPGGRLQFCEVTVETAQTASREREALLQEIQRGCGVA